MPACQGSLSVFIEFQRYLYIPSAVIELKKYVLFIYSNIENLVLWARSEMIGSAIDQTSSWFQVSGVSKYRVLNTDLVATEGQHRWKEVHIMSDSDKAGRTRLLKPDPPPAENLKPKYCC